jgi:site-specific DNA recombinase
LKPEKEWIYTEIEPIVSQEIWTHCNRILDEQQSKRRPPARKPIHLFSGLVFCSCGGKMPVPSKSSNYFCSKCKNKIGIDDLETIFQEQLKTFLFSPEEVTKYFDKADQLIREKEELLNSLTTEEKKIKEEMNKIVQLYLDNQMSKEAVGTHYRPLEERLKQIDQQLPELQGEIDFLKIQYVSSNEVLSEAKDLHTHWPTLTSEEKRRIVETITNKITITNDEVTISLSSIPRPLNSPEWQRNFMDSLRIPA